ncbi:MAG: hypothetical protein WCI05_15370 [Myxococcales bacterium]
MEKNVADDPYADSTGGLGGTSAEDNPADNAAALRGALARMPVEAAQQQAFYDRLTKQLEARRAGPSTAERLYQLSAALAAPTTVRGFSGVMNNVMPVLQQQAQAQREGATSREDALNALKLQQMKNQQGLTGQEVTYRTAVERLGRPTPPGETERLIARALALPDGSPEKQLILGAIRGSPEQMAAQLANRVSVIEATAANRAPPAGSKTPPKYARAPGGGLKKWVP